MSLASLLKNSEEKEFKFGFVINEEKTNDKKKKKKKSKKDSAVSEESVEAIGEGSAVVITDASAAKEAHCSIVDDATNVIKVAKKIEDSRIDSIQTNSPSNAPNSATTKKTATTKVKSSKDTVSTAKTTNNSSNQNKNNKKEKKKESKKVDDDFDDVLESFNLTTVSTAAVSAVTDSSNKKSISDSKVFFVSPNDPEIDNATKMKLKFGNGMNLVAKGPTKVRDPMWISDGAPREQNVTPFTFGFGSLFTNNS